ncbi:MAG: DUF302 domain-containing protein [Dehalococcoidia bacterium]
MTTTTTLAALLPAPMEPALERVRAALKAEGFGILTDVDIQATLREKLGTEFSPYRLLGACNPDFAYRALELDPSLGTFLPCTVAVYDTGAGTEVHIQDPALALTAEAPAGLANLVAAVRAKLERVAAALATADA